MTTFAPVNPYPEKPTYVYERVNAPSKTSNRGPQRFQEGLESDTDVPNDFARGAYADTAPANGRLAVPDAESVFKRADDTMRARAHVGSASWIEAPEVLGDFVQGAGSGDREPTFEYAYNSGMHTNRPNKVRVG